MDRYDIEAAFYDSVYDRTDDIQFYLDYCSATGGPVLELCCGTGKGDSGVGEGGLRYHTSVSTDAVPWKAFQQLRAGGTSLPGVVKDGRFLDQDGMMFFEMHHPDRCITINLDHETYKKIVFEVDDKEAAAQMIRGVLPPHG